MVFIVPHSAGNQSPKPRDCFAPLAMTGLGLRCRDGRPQLVIPRSEVPRFYLKIPDGVYHGLGFQVEHGEPVHMNSSGGWAGS